MSNNYFNFTKKIIETLPKPTKTTVYHDLKTNALKLYVYASGNKSFMLYRKIKGKPERILLGKYPALSISDARTKAYEYNAKIDAGDNPAEKQRAVKQEITFGEAFFNYLEKYAKMHKKTWQQDVSYYETHLKLWSQLKLSDIKTDNIQDLHNKIGNEQNKKYAANRLLCLLHTLFNKTISWGWPHPNPVSGIAKFKEESRERFLESDELPRFFVAVNQEKNRSVRDYVLLSLFIGARQSNILSMKWENINFERNTLFIPKTKNGGAHTVPLVPLAVDILKRRQLQNQPLASPWVFPSETNTGYINKPWRGWLRILKRANIDNLRMHDLRRSLGSWQAATGASLSVISKTLAHKDISTTAIYARLNLDPVRESMEKATGAMLDAGGIK